MIQALGLWLDPFGPTVTLARCSVATACLVSLPWSDSVERVMKSLDDVDDVSRPGTRAKEGGRAREHFVTLRHQHRASCGKQGFGSGTSAKSVTLQPNQLSIVGHSCCRNRLVNTKRPFFTKDGCQRRGPFAEPLCRAHLQDDRISRYPPGTDPGEISSAPVSGHVA
jgi:hypothetical protein